MIDIPCRKIRKTQIVDIKVVVETYEEQYYEKVCECGCVNNCEAPHRRIKYGDNLRALSDMTSMQLQCIPVQKGLQNLYPTCQQNIVRE